MSHSDDLQHALDTLRKQHQALQADYAALQTNIEKQAIALETWMEQRTLDIQAEAQEQRKASTLQRVFYRMAERAAADLSFYEFLQALHGMLNEVLYAKNCYVALGDVNQNTVSFPYYVDERDGDVMQAEHVPMRKGLTEYVLTSGKAQLIDATRFAELQRAGDITEATGDLSFTTWLGVPLRMRGEVVGALVVQSYEGGIHYTSHDADILSFVANHVSAAIERHQALDEMRKSEERYRTVIEKVGVGVVVVQDGTMVFANPALVRIVGHSLEYLLTQPFTATIHPDDVSIVVDRHHKRLRGEPVEAFYGFRIITKDGETRSLELNAVKIEWGKRDATLLFVVDATERLELEKTQRQALQKQIELSDMKSRFISMASHEFRTPLATIHGSVELLQHYGERMPADKKQLTLQKIDESVERMTHMLENVLIIGQANAGHLECKPRPLAITPFCLGLLDETRSALSQQYEKVRVALDLPNALQLYLLDETLIRNVVGNLLSNAIKYSPEGGDVKLHIYEEAKHLVLQVSDQGIGIPASDLPHLFDSFHRASNVGTITGTGLGLSIVKEATHCHGGTIAVQSEPGRGSCFTVHLPLHRVPAPTQR